MICEVCSNLSEDCECPEGDEELEPTDWGDDERAWGYDGDCI